MEVFISKYLLRLLLRARVIGQTVKIKTSPPLKPLITPNIINYILLSAAAAAAAGLVVEQSISFGRAALNWPKTLAAEK